MLTKKKLLFVFYIILLSNSLTYGQKIDKNILKSTDISQIEKFLKDAHPDDPRRIVLKKKLIELKNSAWTRGAKSAQPMAARAIENPGTVSIDLKEVEEYRNLMSETSHEHKEKTVTLLNNLFSDDIGKGESILLVNNHSECNIILRLKGTKEYSLGVPAKGNNFIVVNKGDYAVQGKVCGVLYQSRKNLNKNLSVELSSTTL